MGSSTSAIKILLFIFMAFALGEIVFTIQRYGLPKLNILKPKPGSCKILEEKFCPMGQTFNYKTSQGQKIKYVALKLPMGTPLFSFIDGQRTVIPKITSSTSPFQGASGLSISTLDHNTTATFIGNITIPDNPIVNNGQTVGSIAEQKVKIFGQYDLIFTADEKTLKELFPKL